MPLAVKIFFFFNLFHYCRVVSDEAANHRNAVEAITVRNGEDD